MVAYHACLFLLVAAIFPYMIAAQGFTEVYGWPGPTVIPDDSRMFISDGRVLVQLSTNDTVREARIREQVNITFDCGPHIDAVLARLSGTPPGFTPRTTWYSVIREVDGTFRTTNNTVQETAEIAIFGDNMRFLQIHTPLISVPAKQGNAGLYTCEFCYEFDLPLGGGRGVTCAQSNTDVNVRGDPPVINLDFTPSAGNILISTTICRPVEEVTVVCPQNDTTRPVGTASYLINGMPIDLDNSLTFLRESRVTAAIDDRVSIFVSDFPATFEGVFTCNLTNLFGFDMERSLILLAPTVSSFAGTIQGTASTNCPSGTPANTICPIIGQTVNINCATNGPFNTINITDPNGVLIATNSTSFSVDSGTPFGTYSCTVFNDCGMQTRTVAVQQCLPTITRFGPRTGESTPLPDLCYPTTITGLGGAFTIDCQGQGTNFDTRAWFFNGVQLSSTFCNLAGSQVIAAGNLTCALSNSCGSVSSTVHFPNEPPNINNQSGQITDISNPVLPGQTVCTNPSGPGAQIILQCSLSNFDTSLRSNISWTSNGVKLASSKTPDDGDTLTISVNTIGSYTCLAENDCGSESATVTLLNRPMVNISGILLGATDNGCTPPGDPTEICVIIGSNVTISCSSSHSYTITGSLTRVPPTFSTDAPLTFTTSNNDYGTYTCSSTNACGTSTSTITLRPAMSRPVITLVGSVQGITGDGCTPSTNGKKICVNVSNTVTLSCSSTDDYTIIGPNPQRLSHNKSLTFAVNNNDYGAYICISTNPRGVTTSYIQLDKPSITIPPNGVSITLIYEAITMACSADGATHYQWTDLTTGEIISNNSIHYIATGCDKNKINGQYRCVASNGAGSDTASIKGISSFTCGSK